MSNIALRVDNLGKLYRIGGPQERYLTFRDTFAKILRAPGNKIRDAFRGAASSNAPRNEEIWALRDVSFEVKHGEVVGVIGHNGAGKSTLLKILSRITEPSIGYADVFGRVGALLEVGTGFHPELTGRENVYLNGAILGMSRNDIDRQFDAIVDFADVARFIDTPVKHYSSGMGLRLGFAVAAHLEPEILIVDEVLAVGDVQFQQKCLGKMSEVARGGRTVLFVSHNLAAIQNLCTSAILLDKGQVALHSSTTKVVDTYLEANGAKSSTANFEDTAKTSSKARFVSVSVRPSEDANRLPRIGDDISITTTFIGQERVRNATVCITIWDARGGRIIDANTSMKRKFVDILPNKSYTVTFNLHKVLLRPAPYQLDLFLGVESEGKIDYVPNALQFHITHNEEREQGFVDYPGTYRCEFDFDITDE